MSVNFTPTLEGYKFTGSFRFWCQKVLPLVYDDSLSYYELLCKVVHYLNDVIENADGLYNDITALLQAYNQLQDYVNNYFTELNIQQQINNKLDDMADDGTLDEIINEHIFNELNTEVQNLKVYVTPEMFGAVGDGETDDTTPLLACFASGLPIYIPNKTYVVKQQLLSTNTDIIVSDNGAIVYDGTPTIRVIGITYPENSNKKCYIKGLTIDCNSKVSQGIYVENGEIVEISKCEIHHTNNNENNVRSCLGICVRFANNINIHDNYVHHMFRTVSNSGVIHTCGIEATSDGLINIHKNKVDTIRCDRNADYYMQDCDGIAAYWQNEYAVNNVNIYENEIKNATTRAIKMQCCINNIFKNVIYMSGDLFDSGRLIDIQYGQAYICANKITTVVAGADDIISSDRPIEGHEDIIVKDNIINTYDCRYFVYLGTTPRIDGKIIIDNNYVKSSNYSMSAFRINSTDITTSLEVVIKNNKFIKFNSVITLQADQQYIGNFSDTLGVKIHDNIVRSTSYAMCPVNPSTTPLNFSSIMIKNNQGMRDDISITTAANNQQYVDFNKSKYLTGYFVDLVPLNFPATAPFKRFSHIYQLADSGATNKYRVFVSCPNGTADSIGEGSVWCAPTVSRS